MLDFPRWKKISLWAITLLVALAALPSLLSSTNIRWPEALPDPMVNLGLDLAGGSHLLLETEPEQVATQRLESMEEAVRNALSDAQPRIQIGDISTADGRLTFMLEDPATVDAARDLIEPLTEGAGLTGQRDWTIDFVDGNRFLMEQTDAGLDLAVTQAMDSAAEIVRRRIDNFGTRESSVTRQSDTRIVVQVPGFDDPEALKALLGETAELEFKLVCMNAQPTEIAQGIAPPGCEILPYAEDTGFAGRQIAVRRLGGIRGDSLTDAQQSFDDQTDEPIVRITFNSQAASRWATITTENVGRPFAIILDDEVISSPNITEPILSPTSKISGGFTAASADDLAIQLRSGALPVDLTVIEERTVGPDLGADSIRAGMIAMGVGSLLVVLLMIATYGRFGVYATGALVLNVLMILGIMAVLDTTLTLPGIAGFVLTIGAAVDANVLINERIREERKRGRKVIAAVENGYREASRAIYDANVTNFIAGVLLFMFGSGPVRGFAVVLIIGLFTSVFTAVTLTRMWVAGWLRETRPTDIQI
jgi:preprotein translocase subunit SecD